MKALPPSFHGKYNCVSGKQWTDLFVIEKLGKGKGQEFEGIMTKGRQRKDGRCSQSLVESDT